VRFALRERTEGFLLGARMSVVTSAITVYAPSSIANDSAFRQGAAQCLQGTPAGDAQSLRSTMARRSVFCPIHRKPMD
jgi:hypothetical protein